MPGALVCVTGMHRSGSSVTSRVLNLIGVDLGAPDALLHGLKDNPAGHWEHLELVRLSERVLSGFGGSWDDPPLLLPGYEDAPRLREVRRVADEVMARDFGRGRVAGWKDPRSSLLLAFWRTVTPISRSILVIRDPRHVAGSLATRNGFAAERSAYLWLRYTCSAWRDDPDRLLLSYEGLCQDVLGTAHGLAAELGLPAPDPVAAEQIAAALRPELRHDRAGSDGPIMDVAIELHRLLEAGQEAQASDLVDDLFRRWHRAGPADARARRVRTSLRPLAHPGVRRRVRSQVGAVTGGALQRATAIR